jgi:hypothetical protein
MSRGKKIAPQRFNTVALQNWDTTQELVGFFFTHTAKAIQNNVSKLENVLQSLDQDQQKEVQLALEMNQALAVLSSKFTPEQILATLEFLAQGRSIAYLFTKEDIERMEAQSV